MLSAEQEEDEAAFFESGWLDDEERIDVYGVFVLEDMPVADIENVFRSQEDYGNERLWLADDYNNLPDFYFHLPSHPHTKLPLDPNWQSPFRGKTVADVAEFLRSVPKPRKPLCKTYFAVLDKTLYREQGHILVCKVLEDGQVQSIPCVASFVGVFFGGHERYMWANELSSWEEYGSVAMSDV
ncbi:hypothetical protein CKM354_000980900 [Cercospora kikuchii]|uniref:Uncharacterized protein n=1 Tax=Cercospora kikuchii TaxID=84275 RepID=A0A9P3CP16_9PEZI|nr:uncharacterized protein CKM354_000980900 [Cercospora kikuchii]GIZ46692.1 hypothetical protein CKM354_000980900 [Cercospora kikuchii]